MITQNLIIPNVHEFTRRGMDPRFPESVLKVWRHAGMVFADLALFWGSGEKLIVTPQPLDPQFVQYIRDFLRLEPVSILTPDQYTSDFSGDILADKTLLEQLRGFVQGAPTTLLCWGATTDLYRVTEALSTPSAALELPDIPQRDAYWINLYIDSKVGFRHLCTGLHALHPEIAMPEGFICDSFDIAVEATRYFNTRGKACVLKANLGVGGLGVLVVEPESVAQPLKTLHRYLQLRSRELPYFSQGPVVVEQFIASSTKLIEADAIAGSIFINGFISKERKIQIFGGGCEMRDRHNHYIGAQLGKGSLFEQFAAQIESIATMLFGVIAGYGYRGHIGLDFLVDDVGRLVLLELNPRRSGESHVYDLGAQLFGSDWLSTHHAVSRLPLLVELAGNIEVGHVLEAFEEVNYQFDQSVVIVPTCMSWLSMKQPGLGYVVFGEDSQTVYSGEEELRRQLARRGLKAQNP